MKKKMSETYFDPFSYSQIAVPIPRWLNRYLIGNLFRESRNIVSPCRAKRAQEILASLPVTKKDLGQKNHYGKIITLNIPDESTSHKVSGISRERPKFFKALISAVRFFLKIMTLPIKILRRVLGYAK
jgi:hypothetical protein